MSDWNDRRGRRFCADVLRKLDPSYTVSWRMTQPKRDRPWRRTPTWPGDGRLMMSERDLIRALHDVAHVLLASPRRRRLPEFGLGPDPANEQKVDRIVPFEFARREEHLACDLHWCLAAYLEGIDGALEVEDYVDTNVPDAETIASFGRRFRYQLPPDFTAVVLATHTERRAQIDTRSRAEVLAARAALRASSSP